MSSAVNSKEDFEALSERITMLEGLHSRQSQIARLQEEVARLHMENEQMESAFKNSEAVVKELDSQILTMSSVPIAGSVVATTPPASHTNVDEQQPAEPDPDYSCSNDYFERQAGLAVAWEEAIKQKQRRIQVFYMSPDMRDACHQIPGQIQVDDVPFSIRRLNLGGPMTPKATSQGLAVPTDCSSRLLELPRELRIKIWKYAIGTDLYADYKWLFYSECCGEGIMTVHRYDPPGQELPRLRLTSRLITNDLENWSKPSVVWSFPDWRSIGYYISRMTRNAATTVSYIDLKCPASISDEVIDAIFEVHWTGEEERVSLSMYGVQDQLPEAYKAQHLQLLGGYFQSVELVTVDIHLAVILGSVHDNCEDCEKCNIDFMQHWRFKVGSPTTQAKAREKAVLGN